jgi:hypothetical protein
VQKLKSEESRVMQTTPRSSSGSGKEIDLVIVASRRWRKMKLDDVFNMILLKKSLKYGRAQTKRTKERRTTEEEMEEPTSS